MNTTPVIDLEDAEGLIAADRDGLLRAASTAGAQVRATAAAVDEGALESLHGARPRTVTWVAGRGTAEAAGALLASTWGAAAAEPIVIVNEAPPWIGPLDVLVVAGDDPGDPTLVGAAATGVRRGARVVVVAPYAGPLRDATAGRVAVLEPRMRVPDEFGLCRYLAAGLAAAHTVDPKLRIDLGLLADQLDAETLRNSVAREVFTNPAKALAVRMSGSSVALAGDSAATLALARHGSSTLLRVGCRVIAATGLTDAVAAWRAMMVHTGFRPGYSGRSLFHDEEIDGPLPERLRVLALTLAEERTVVAARIAGLDDVYLVAAETDEVPEAAGAAGEGASVPAGVGSAEQQLAVLAVRLEMAAVYLRLGRG